MPPRPGFLPPSAAQATTDHRRTTQPGRIWPTAGDRSPQIRSTQAGQPSKRLRRGQTPTKVRTPGQLVRCVRLQATTRFGARWCLSAGPEARSRVLPITRRAGPAGSKFIATVPSGRELERGTNQPVYRGLPVARPRSLPWTRSKDFLDAEWPVGKLQTIGCAIAIKLALQPTRQRLLISATFPVIDRTAKLVKDTHAPCVVVRHHDLIDLHHRWCDSLGLRCTQNGRQFKSVIDPLRIEIGSDRLRDAMTQFQTARRTCVGNGSIGSARWRQFWRSLVGSGIRFALVSTRDREAKKIIKIRAANQ